MRVLVTGATGFVGRALVSTLGNDRVRAAVRTRESVLDGVDSIVVGDINGRTQWSEALSGVDCVVHLAARVHVMQMGRDDERLFCETNVDGTRALAEAADRHGVKRFIFLSSIKVNGEGTTDAPYTAKDEPNPSDAYGVSKREAERALLSIARPGFEVVIIRPPLVYGPGVRANFRQLLATVRRGIPMPFGAVNNARSLVGIWNLCDLIRHTIERPIGDSQILMVSDGEDVSSAELIRRIAHAMDRPVRLLPIPVSILKLLGKLTGRSAQILRLVGSLTVDISATRSDLHWSPPVSLDEGLRRTAAWFKQTMDDK